MARQIEDWFHVTFDEDLIHIHIDIPEREEVRESLSWSEIIRVCFKTGEFMHPDEIYIFIKSRPESFLIPSDADGGTLLWGEIIDRGLFDAELAIEAATSPPDELFCWPEQS